MGFQPQISTEHLPVQKSHSGPNCLTGREERSPDTDWNGVVGEALQVGAKGENVSSPGISEKDGDPQQEASCQGPKPCLLSEVVTQADSKV